MKVKINRWLEEVCAYKAHDYLIFGEVSFDKFTDSLNLMPRFHTTQENNSRKPGKFIIKPVRVHELW